MEAETEPDVEEDGSPRGDSPMGPPPIENTPPLDEDMRRKIEQARIERFEQVHRARGELYPIIAVSLLVRGSLIAVMLVNVALLVDQWMRQVSSIMYYPYSLFLMRMWTIAAIILSELLLACAMCESVVPAVLSLSLAAGGFVAESVLWGYARRGSAGGGMLFYRYAQSAWYISLLLCSSVFSVGVSILYMVNARVRDPWGCSRRIMQHARCMGEV
jgi:hypothetical protein